MLADGLKDVGIRRVVLPTVKEVISANTMFEQAMFEKMVCHSGQPSLEQAATNCEKRAIGTAGGFGYKALREGIEIGLLDSVMLAYWSAVTVKVKSKQKIDY